jgi:nucleoside-diphosphate kinase
MEQTVILVKPDGVKRGLIGEIVHRVERMGLKIVGMKMVWPNKELLHQHYGTNKESTILRLGNKTLSTYQKYGKDAKKELGTDNPSKLGKMVVGWLLDYVTSGPVVAMLIEGRHAVDNVLALAGPTMPVSASPGTIRGDYSTDSAAYANNEKRGVTNLIHISGSIEEANFEKTVWFKPSEIFKYKRADELV